MSKFYDRSGREITMDQWRASWSEAGNRVASTTVGETKVSTVWLGMDHGWGEGPPMIFETMTFDGPHNGYCERYATEADAIAGHERVVAALTAGLSPEAPE